MIRKITGQNNNTPTKHLTHNNLKIRRERYSKSSHRNFLVKFIRQKPKQKKVKIKFQSKNTETYNQPFSIAELKESFNKAHNTAVGPDKIHYHFLKDLPEPANFLQQIFNDLWNSGDIPKIWKETTVIPISEPFIIKIISLINQIKTRLWLLYIWGSQKDILERTKHYTLPRSI